MRKLRMIAFTLTIAPTPAMVAQEIPDFASNIEPSITLGPEVLASPNEDGGALRCEPSAALHGSHVIVAWNDSWGGQQGSQIGVAIGWSRSRDGGGTFEFGGYLPAPGEGEPPSGADSRLAVDSAGNFYLVVLSWYPTRKVLRLYTMNPETQTEWIELAPPLETEGELIDKPGLCVTADGRVAIVLTKGNAIVALTSLDRGRTFLGAQIVSETSEGEHRSGATAAWVGERCLVTWMEGATEVWFASSSDNTKSFSTPRRLATLEARAAPPSGYAMGIGPTDRIANDAVVVGDHVDGEVRFFATWAEGTEQGTRVTLVRSEDAGTTWSEPTPVGMSPDAAPKAFPTLALARNRPSLLYYDRRDSPRSSLTGVYLSTWTSDFAWADTRLDTVASDWSEAKGDGEFAMIQRNFGDYITLASSGSQLLAVWTDAREGPSRIFARSITLK